MSGLCRGTTCMQTADVRWSGVTSIAWWWLRQLGWPLASSPARPGQWQEGPLDRAAGTSPAAILEYHLLHSISAVSCDFSRGPSETGRCFVEGFCWMSSVGSVSGRARQQVPLRPEGESGDETPDRDDYPGVVGAFYHTPMFVTRFVSRSVFLLMVAQLVF